MSEEPKPNQPTPAAIDLGVTIVVSGTNDDLTNALALAKLSGDPLSLALGEYRQDNFSNAASLAAQISDTDPLRAAQATAVLAMAQTRLKQTGDGGALLARANNAVEAARPKNNGDSFGSDWRDWIAARVLTTEAAAGAIPANRP